MVEALKAKLELREYHTLICSYYGIEYCRMTFALI